MLQFPGYKKYKYSRMKKQEIKFIYNSGKKTDRDAYALIKSLDKHVVNELDVLHNKMTPTQLAGLAESLHVSIDGLFDTSLDVYNKEIREISDDDKLTIINNDMSFLKTPIVISQAGDAVVLTSPFDLNPIDMVIGGLKNDTYK
jgi:arsenate reductase-like glutaredoxin family protein